MNENEMKKEINGEKKEVAINQNQRKANYGMEGLHPFWSFFNDCFSDNDTADVMKTDITDEGGDYRLEVEVPGVDKKDVKISLDKGYLSITARVNSSENQGHGKNIHRERYYGSFRRSFYVGNSIEKDNISASMNNGILVVKVNKPKEKADDEKFIQIQ